MVKEVLFAAKDAAHGYELWVTDGTSAGTSLVQDLNPGPSYSNPSYIADMGNGKAVFQATDPTHGSELWVTDGTNAGTSLVGDITPGVNGTYPQDIAGLGNGKAVFDDSSHSQLWVTDGTAAGTSVVASVALYAGVRTNNHVYFTGLSNGKALFQANDGTHGYELWVTDGTNAGTSMVEDINPGSVDSAPSHITAIGNGKALFEADDGTHGEELWVSDGTAMGTSMVADINPGSGDSGPYPFAALGNGKVIFNATDGTSGYELWVTDGTAAGTSLVQDIDPGSSSSNPQQFTALGNGKAVFVADDGTHGRELWVTNGTSAGTSMVTDIYSGAGNSSNPSDIAALGNGKAVFMADDGTNRYGLWVTDGTSAGTSLLTTFPGNTTPVSGTTLYDFTPVGNGEAVFRGTDIHGAVELWVTDGTAGGTSMITIGSPSAPVNLPRNLAVFTTALCFVAGTLIATPSGQVPVEALRTGQTVLTASGAERPIAWIGQGQILATRGRRGPATPVIVKKGALADNVPSRDLHVTKGHALYLDDVLIPVGFLVNHRSIVWDDHAQEVKLYHIELDSHDVLLANGAPAESYRDDGNRWLFNNANSGWDQPAKPPYAPVLTGGAVVDAIWRRLLDRAGPRASMPLTDDADLHVVADGAPLYATRHEDGRYVFHLPGTSTDIRIVSRASAPQELGLARDPRVLGVAVRDILLRRRDEERAIPAEDRSLTEGFHAFETENGWRWTDSAARLPAEMVQFGAGPIELIVAVASTGTYLDSGESRRAA